MQGHDHEVDERHSPVSKTERTVESPLLLRAMAEGRPDVLGSNGVLNMQRKAGNLAVQRMASDAKSPVLDVIAGGGRPLEEPVRHDMEARLGADFSDVRIHDDSAAHASAKSVSAHAYTVGNRIVFQRDAYAPDTPGGAQTLAHELTHVIQQRNGPVDGTPTGAGVSVSDPSDRFEREAVANAERVMANEHSTTDSGASVTAEANVQ